MSQCGRTRVLEHMHVNNCITFSVCVCVVVGGGSQPDKVPTLASSPPTAATAGAEGVVPEALPVAVAGADDVPVGALVAGAS